MGLLPHWQCNAVAIGGFWIVFWGRIGINMRQKQCSIVYSSSIVEDSDTSVCWALPDDLASLIPRLVCRLTCADCGC